MWWGNCSSSDNKPNFILQVGTHVVNWSHLRLVNSPLFHLIPSSSESTIIDHVTIHSPYTKHSCNLDGIDPMYSNNVWIKNVVIHSGDDCVAVKQGSTNILVENSLFQTGHGASIGSIKHGDVVNVTFRNIKFHKASDGEFENGARIKTWKGGSGTIKNITYDTITMVGVPNPLLVTTTYSDLDLSVEERILNYILESIRDGKIAEGAQHLAGKVQEHVRRRNDPQTEVQISDITFKKIHASQIPKKKGPSITCQRDAPCEGFYFEDITFDHEMTCSHVFGRYGNPPFQPSSVSTCLHRK
ncbi:glycoside hydrolase family 28 protein [Patescibacteria group bacterium]|nr:glycoside hydrolase family 28 protein [Patescibacteria group bacterium]